MLGQPPTRRGVQLSRQGEDPTAFEVVRGNAKWIHRHLPPISLTAEEAPRLKKKAHGDELLEKTPLPVASASGALPLRCLPWHAPSLVGFGYVPIGLDLPHPKPARKKLLDQSPDRVIIRPGDPSYN